MIVVSLVVYVVYTLLGTGVYRLMDSAGCRQTKDPGAAFMIIVFWPVFLVFEVFSE